MYFHRGATSLAFSVNFVGDFNVLSERERKEGCIIIKREIQSKRTSWFIDLQDKKEQEEEQELTEDKKERKEEEDHRREEDMKQEEVN